MTTVEPPVTQPQTERREVAMRGLGFMSVLRWLLVVMSLAAAVFAWSTYFQGSSSQGSDARYQCPMHPQIVSSDPGECPICHMALEPVEASRGRAAVTPAGRPSSAASSAAHADHADHADHAGHAGHAGAAASAPAATLYTCPMHPQVLANQPGTCPICKMDLVPKLAEASPDATGSEKEPAAAPSGVVPVELDFDRVQAIGVRTALASAGTASTLRMTASVVAPESGSVEVRARAAGFVEQIFVGEIGVSVGRGQPLLSLYSPEIYQAFSDYLLASRWAPGDDRAGDTLVAARRRLELLGVSSAALQRANASKEVPRNVSLVAPASGYVVEKNASRGSYVTPETLLFRIVDLGQVFVVADVPSSELTRVSRGQKAIFLPSARPELRVESEVDLVYPSVALDARTLRVRLTLDNRKLGLLPGEYGVVELAAEAGSAVWVPRDALIDTGLEKYVFIESARGRYEPRAVTTGMATAERIEITRGVRAGQAVVSGATFLLDSESRLRAALSESAPSAPARSSAPAPQSKP